MDIRNWKDISYLNNGNSKQKKSYEILTSIDIFKLLHKFNPVLVGTIPIEIDIDNSDLDIICEVKDFIEFKDILVDKFSKYEEFKISYDNEKPLVLCNFKVENMEIEIYGSIESVENAYGYRHMILEYRLLNLLGTDFRKNIIKLKQDGLKTEPSFAKLLKIEGNPYEGLLLFENYTDEEIVNKYYDNI